MKRQLKIQEEKEEDHQPLLETKLMIKTLIAGVDEVGKGCLFGPVFAGAVILNKSHELKLLREGLKDSKKLNFKQRSILVPLIKKNSIAWSIGQASAREIDKEGIRTATEKAMIRALQKLLIPPESIIVDGILPIRLWQGKQKTQIRGESYFASIAAASILAKQERDELIKRLSKKYTRYGLERNKGYGTKMHRNNIIKEGLTPLHRISFLSNLRKS